MSISKELVKYLPFSPSEQSCHPSDVLLIYLRDLKRKTNDLKLVEYINIIERVSNGGLPKSSLDYVIKNFLTLNDGECYISRKYLGIYQTADLYKYGPLPETNFSYWKISDYVFDIIRNLNNLSEPEKWYKII